MVRLGIFFHSFLSTLIRKIIKFILPGSIYFFLTPIAEKRKTIWSELELNPGPLAPQATTLTTRPWLLGLQVLKVILLCTAEGWNARTYSISFGRSHILSVASLHKNDETEPKRRKSLKNFLGNEKTVSSPRRII